MQELARSFRQWHETPIHRLAIVFIMAWMVFMGASVSAVGQDDDGASAPLPAPLSSDEPWYGATRIVAVYPHTLPELPQLGDFSPELGQTAAGYVAPRDGVPATTLEPLGNRRSDGAPEFDYFSSSAIDSIASQLTAWVNDKIDVGYSVVTTVVDPGQIDAGGNDLRTSSRQPLRFFVVVDGPFYPVTEFRPTYFRDNPGLPDVNMLMGASVTLHETSEGFVGYRPDVAPTVASLADLAAMGERQYSASALLEVASAVANYLNEQNIIGVFVAPSLDELEIDSPELTDKRVDTRSMTLLINAGMVSQIRTIASGDRIPPDDRLNNPMHQRILNESPVQPGGEESVGSLLLKQDLDEYIYRLNRHPGRRVDLALSAGRGVGDVTLDYLIAENKPVFIYGQISNTGTRQTDRVRERFGIINNQLTNNDDLLNVDFITASFDETNALQVSYESRLGDNERWRFRVNGSWSEYTASDVGFAGEEFEGESYGGGAALVYNFHQRGELFIDLVFGLRYQDIEVTNNLLQTQGQTDLWTPHIGIELERDTETATTLGRVALEYGTTDASTTDLNNLGRLTPDEDWLALVWDAQHSFFLEPALNREAWEDVTTEQSSTLAHEIAVSFRGQWAFEDSRLIPQSEQVAGGLFSVRGYPESIAAGDTVLIGSVEYRYHIPRAFKVNPNPREGKVLGKPFRFAPQQIYGRPDWDLIVRGFFDVGHTIVNNPFSFENDETLVGTGIGVELQLRQNINVRADWGFALEGIDNEVNSGSNRLHVIATIIF